MSASAVTVGGSEIGAVCGLDPWCDPTTLAARKLGLIPAQPETEAMLLGTRLEPLVAELASERGYPLLPAEKLTDPERPWCVGTPDGTTLIGNVAAVAELKTVGVYAHRDWDDLPPLRYQAQCQWYMHLTGLSAAVVVALVGGQRVGVYHLERDDTAIVALLDAGEQFVDVVRRGKLPEPDGSDSARSTLGRLHPAQTTGAVVRAGRAEMEAYRALLDVRQAEERIKAQKQALENTLKAYIGDAETLVAADDAPLVHWRAVASGRLDGSALRRDHPDIHAEYSQSTTTRRFTVT